MKLIAGDDEIECVNGFVSRTVAVIHEENTHDAKRLAEILNKYFQDLES